MVGDALIVVVVSATVVVVGSRVVVGASVVVVGASVVVVVSTAVVVVSGAPTLGLPHAAIRMPSTATMVWLLILPPLGCRWLDGADPGFG